MKSGVGNASILVKGKGPNLASPFPISDAINVTVQFVRNPGPGVDCWETVLPSPATNDGSRFNDKIR